MRRRELTADRSSYIHNTFRQNVLCFENIKQIILIDGGKHLNRRGSIRKYVLNGFPFNSASFLRGTLLPGPSNGTINGTVPP